jgi:DNA repair protein RadC
MNRSTDLHHLSDQELLQLMESSTHYSPYVLGMEYLKRNKTRDVLKVGFPGDVLPLIYPYTKRKQEYFFIITLNAAHEVIKKNLITKGILNRTIIHPREVYRKALQQNAVSLIAAHNHPSGNVNPSAEDREITIRLYRAGELMGITLLDHIIFAKDDYYSFLEHGELEWRS